MRPQPVTLDLTAEEIHEIGLREVTRIERDQNNLARHEGFPDRNAFYADRLANRRLRARGTGCFASPN